MTHSKSVAIKDKDFHMKNGDKGIFWNFLLVIRRDYKQKSSWTKNFHDDVKLADTENASMVWRFTALDIWFGKAF